MKVYSINAVLKAKLKATAIHAGITVLIILATAPVIFLVWYSDGLARLAGGVELYKIVLGVEVCLGPLMSLVIYNPKKSTGELMRDYLVVGIIQVSALFYGLYTSFIARPVYIVFVLDRLEVVSAVELEKEDILEASLSEFKALPLFGTKEICVEMPTDAEEKSDLIFLGLAGKDIHLIPKYYRHCHPGEIYEKAESTKALIERLRRDDVKDKFVTEISRILKGNYKWMPIKSRFDAQVVLLSEDGNYTYIDIDPFF